MTTKTDETWVEHPITEEMRTEMEALVAELEAVYVRHRDLLLKLDGDVDGDNYFVDLAITRHDLERGCYCKWEEA